MYNKTAVQHVETRGLLVSNLTFKVLDSLEPEIISSFSPAFKKAIANIAPRLPSAAAPWQKQLANIDSINLNQQRTVLARQNTSKGTFPARPILYFKKGES